jgi:hypothetical protein
MFFLAIVFYRKVSTMKNVWLILFVTGLAIVACRNDKENEELALDKSFIYSFSENKFAVLEKFLPTRSFYKSLGDEVDKLSDAEIDSFLSRSNTRLKTAWERINSAIREKNIDPRKIKLKESVVYNPFSQNSFQAMVLVYEYENKIWDDLSLIIRTAGDSTYLLEIPNPTKAFSFSDTSLSESSQAKAANELKQPEFRESLKSQVNKLAELAKEENLDGFAEFAAYHGEDKERSWKSPVNMEHPEESVLAKKLMQEVKSAMSSCDDFIYEEIRAERESEGYWIVQPVRCKNRIIYFAFLKIKDRLLLGDLNVETTGEL